MPKTHELDALAMAVLLDVHDILLTCNTDETSVLQSICEKLFSSLSFDLVWGGLISPDSVISIVCAAGSESGRIQGITYNCLDSPIQKQIKACMDHNEPVFLANGLNELDSRQFDNLPAQARAMPLTFYPLTLESSCVGILAAGSHHHQQLGEHDHTLLQLAARHAGFILNMLRSATSKTNAQSHVKLAAAVFDSSLEGIYITDTQGTILAANAAATRITGYTTEELIGNNPRILKSNYHDPDFYVALWDAIRRNNQWEGEIWNLRKDGELFTEWLSISAIKNDHGEVQNYVGIFIDISKQKQAENRLAYQAFHDALTGLPNRYLFFDRLDWAILQAKRHQTSCAVLFIDLDHFKYVNDTFGHDKGDLVLQKTAQKIKSCIRENDTFARMGGDEFTVLLQDFDTLDDISLTSQRIIQALESPIYINGQKIYVSASIGVSIFPEDGEDASVLMKHADTAMYSAKNDGRKRHHFFKLSMESYAVKRVEMEEHLRNALLQGEFKVFYQPQINLATGHIVGAEALVRWQRPNLGLIPPGQFIPYAEETGLIIPIGEWVLREACTQCQFWQQTGWPSLRIGVNLSAHQFKQTGLFNMVHTVLKDTGLKPQFLDLELTESDAMQNVDASLKILMELKELGIQVSIDDFGTGYSSLSYLKQFPIDRLKIDRSFIADIATDPNDATIVQAIVAMAHCLSLDVVAEGVETEEQLKFLRQHGCNEVQGYFLGHPVPADEFRQLLAQPVSAW